MLFSLDHLLGIPRSELGQNYSVYLHGWDKVKSVPSLGCCSLSSQVKEC